MQLDLGSLSNDWGLQPSPGSCVCSHLDLVPWQKYVDSASQCSLVCQRKSLEINIVQCVTELVKGMTMIELLEEKDSSQQLGNGKFDGHGGKMCWVLLQMLSNCFKNWIQLEDMLFLTKDFVFYEELLSW